MERKIGETFEYEGEKLKVVNAGTACDGCYFKGKSCDNRNYDITGICGWTRKDNQPVRFIKVAEEQQAEQSQKLNLCEILKDCPRGWMFWSPMLGDVKLHHVRQEAERVSVILKSGATWDINADGTITVGGDTSPEVMLFPNKWQRDWSKFTAPWLKKERFDPKTFKAFDRVLVKDEYSEIWSCDLFSHLDNEESYKYFTISTCWNYCIPYNDDTKHLVGTKDEAPEFYKYWED